MLYKDAEISRFVPEPSCFNGHVPGQFLLAFNDYYEWLNALSRAQSHIPKKDLPEIKFYPQGLVGDNKCFNSTLPFLAGLYCFSAEALIGSKDNAQCLNEAELDAARINVGLGLGSLIELVSLMGQNRIRWGSLPRTELKEGEKFSREMIANKDNGDSASVSFIPKNRSLIIGTTQQVPGSTPAVELNSYLEATIRGLRGQPDDLKLRFGIWNSLGESGQKEVLKKVVGSNDRMLLASGEDYKCLWVERDVMRLLYINPLYIRYSDVQQLQAIRSYGTPEATDHTLLSDDASS